MKPKYAQLLRIAGKRRITKEADRQFLHQLRRGLLLALLERGTIDAAQYRQAEENRPRD